MTASNAKKQKNQALECWKLIAAIFVIFIHAPFPGRIGTYITSLSRFAVPLFFAISGYFSLNVRRDKLTKRVIHIFKLNCLAILIYVFWFYLLTLYYGGSSDPLRLRLLTVENLVRWAFLHINPYAIHLWYLTAVFVCYVLLWIYVSFFGQGPIRYRLLYIISLLLFAFRFIAADLSILIGIDVPYYLFRDGWFLGLPMFSLGIFLHQHQDALLAKSAASDRRLILLLLIGAVLCPLQTQLLKSSELPLGAVLQVASILLLTARHPQPAGSSKRFASITSTFGFLSTAIYMLHFSVEEAYIYMIRPYWGSYLGAMEPWLMPLLVAAATLLMSIVLERIVSLFRSLFRL